MVGQALPISVTSSISRRVLDGGDGGRGGHVIVRGSRQFWTLIHLKFARHVFAEDGEGGGRERAFGRDGKDQIIDIPPELWSRTLTLARLSSR